MVHIPSGEHTKSYEKSPFLMGKPTISMAIFHCYVSSPEGIFDVSCLNDNATMCFPGVSSGEPGIS